MNEKDKAEDFIRDLKTIQALKYTNTPSFQQLEEDLGQAVVDFIDSCELDRDQESGLLALAVAHLTAKLLCNRFE